ncbi:BREX-1 system adenine-specific DNA-methyltransferase PglX [Psychrobacter okhotskensis]|uniref:BREX-1 system adenine-specific DNA-methyltransferase PglX n=1 Tax=Psychrobacter okhotskensis TaxID=212403 RepID=UPI00191A3656|nr:BREX-1 system adenine-specific DNA-methyltransferase PglX [Psychrobacter okhotskensis]
METSNIKSYAPKARLEFMDAVAKRLNTFGISINKKGELQVTEAIIQGSVLQIGDNNFDSSLAQRRQRLVERSQQLGYEQLVEQVAYTWFNRLSAIRYMEIHGYLGHGFRVLSHPSGEKQFEIIDHAQDAAEELGLDRNHIIDLKLAGNKNEELYRELLLGQCHKLHEAMPFLFESLNDETELLLPDNLTRTDSILRGLVDSIPEEDWQQVEVIGWLYQFYISDKKDEVIGKVVKSEDIPAATQLFTPNWIVKYLVQNSVGRHWLQTYPDSPIKEEMEYYIEPAEQTDEVNEQLKAITPESIDPESIKVLDPASGSGHILIEAYNVLKAIYEERGYRSRDIPKLILENNLYGLDIDDRAAQLSGFSLMMMARQDDRRIFSRDVQLNVLSLQETGHLDLPKLWQDLNLSGEFASGQMQDMFGSDLDLSSFEADNRYQLLQRNIERFKQAKTFGSLIEVPATEHDALQELYESLRELAEQGDSIQRAAVSQIINVVHQALILSIRYDAVVANPPYMGSKGMNKELKSFAEQRFPNSKTDLFAIFIERNLKLTACNGQLGFMTPFVWMFISSYEQLRVHLISDETITSLIQLEYSGFDGATVPICTFTLMKGSVNSYKASYIKLSDFKGAKNQSPKVLEAIRNPKCGWFYITNANDFNEIPGSPIAYWTNKEVRSCFTNKKIMDSAKACQGLITGNTNKFIRLWPEVSIEKIGLHINSREETVKSSYKWFPIDSGGGYRKWYGNNTDIVNWENDGQEIRNYKNERGKLRSRPQNMDYYFREGVTWGKITSSKFSCRLSSNSIFSDAGMKVFSRDGIEGNMSLLAMLNSNLAEVLLKALSPTLNYELGQLKNLPILNIAHSEVGNIINIFKRDWDSFEISIDFQRNLFCIDDTSKLSTSIERLSDSLKHHVLNAKKIEEEINSSLMEAFKVKGISPCVAVEKISLSRNYYEDIKGSVEWNDNAMVSDLVLELLSYTIGCMMGRYSLDQEGLVYAHAGNEGFDASLYKTFPADSDGIVPIMDDEWFKDDACNRVVEFVKTVWGEDNLTENLQFIAESLSLDAITARKSETSVETIRRYLSTKFYKDHMQTYKNRPIYWLFSSGKEKAFECLVYLHRYNESTLSRMRTEYVTPLLGKYQAYAEQLDKQIDMAESTQDKKRLERELKSMDKKQSELREFDDKLKHYADMRILIDLDDGVKENYGKFGDLLAEVKKITGEKPEIINAN